MEASNINFRCSGLAHIMGEGNVITEKQLEQLAYLESRPKPTDNQKDQIAKLINKRDNPELGEQVKTHLLDIFASHKYGRREELISKHLDKGNEREEDSITLISRTTGILFEKNSSRLHNNFIQGEPDMFIGEKIENAEHVFDSKTSWSLHTFLRAKYKKLDPLYYWQGVGYMDLTGAKTHTVCFCLVNGTAQAIIAEKKQLAYKMRETDLTSSAFVKKCQQIEINHIFDIDSFKKEYPGFAFDNDINNWKWDIPMDQRIHTFKFERNEEDIRKVHDRVLECREWMEINLFEPYKIA